MANHLPIGMDLLREHHTQGHISYFQTLLLQITIKEKRFFFKILPHLATIKLINKEINRYFELILMLAIVQVLKTLIICSNQSIILIKDPTNLLHCNLTLSIINLVFTLMHLLIFHLVQGII